MLLKPAPAVVEPAPVTSAFWRGTGTREEEKGEAPADGIRLGFGLPLMLPFPKATMNEPVMRRESSDGADVIELTRAWAPAMPVNGGFDQLPALGS